MINELEDLQIEEIAFVDKGAGKGVRVALFKNYYNKEEAKKMKSLEEIMGSLSEEDAAVVMQAMEELKHEEEEKAEAEKMDLEDEKQKIKREEKDKAHTPSHEDDKEIEKRLSVLKSENHVMREQIAKMQAERERELFVKRAEALPNVPTFSTEELGEFLMHVNKSLPAQLAEKTESFIKSVNNICSESSLIKEFGSAGIGSSRSGSAMARAEAMASEITKRDPKISKAKALNEVWTNNPELRREYRQERRGNK